MAACTPEHAVPCTLAICIDLFGIVYETKAMDIEITGTRVLYEQRSNYFWSIVQII